MASNPSDVLIASEMATPSSPIPQEASKIIMMLNFYNKMNVLVIHI